MSRIHGYEIEERLRGCKCEPEVVRRIKWIVEHYPIVPRIRKIDYIIAAAINIVISIIYALMIAGVI